MSILSFKGQGSVKKSSASITIAALSAAAEEDISITDSDAAVGDIVVCSLLEADMETGVAVIGAWVSAAGTIKVRLSNVHTSALTGGAATIHYALIRGTV